MPSKEDAKNCKIKGTGRGDDLDIDCDQSPFLEFGINAKEVNYPSNKNKCLIRNKKDEFSFDDFCGFISTNIFAITENKITSFPRDLRKSLSESIYRELESGQLSKEDIIKLLIYSLMNPNSKQSIIKNYKNSDMEKIKNKIEKSLDYNTALYDYLDDLIYIISQLKTLNDINQHINFTQLITEIIKEKKNLNLKRRGLEVALSEIYDYLKVKIQDFSLRRSKRKYRSGNESEKESVRSFIKEYRLLNEMYNGHFGGKCFEPNCDVDFRRLPVFEFHHLDPKLKKSTWNKIMHMEYSSIKKQLESEIVIIICANCHHYKTATIHMAFENIIMKKDLFSKTPTEIEQVIETEIGLKIKDKSKQSYLKFEIKRWIKKRAVFEQLYQGKCVGCGESRLPALQAHHIDSRLKTKKWGDVSRKWSIKKLINDFLVKEECICLCANCHSMLSSTNFEKNVIFILGEGYIEEVKRFFVNLRKNIFKASKRIRDIKNSKLNLEIVNFF